MGEAENGIKCDNYVYLVKKGDNEKAISSRFDWLLNLLSTFIQKKHLENQVIVSCDILKHVIIDYFVDIDRLKDFQGITDIHSSKLYAYLSFWILRHKPLQIILSEHEPDLTFINEEFVTYLIRSYLFSDPENVALLEGKKESVDNFVATMLYYFQYREYSTKNIELMLLAFQAGCAYQYSADHQ